MTKTEKNVDSQARRKGRRVVMTAYFFVVIAICSVPLVQITMQAFFPPTSGASTPPSSCKEGISSLYQAVVRARSGCRGLDVPEPQAVAKFRAMLGPEWTDLRPFENACRGDEAALDALDAVKVLRYTEEMIIRHGAIQAATARKKAERLVQPYLSSPRQPSSATKNSTN